MSKPVQFLILAMAVFQLSFPVLAACEVLTPATTIQSTVDNVRKTVVAQEGKVSPEVLEQELRKIIAPVFDFETMAQSCLGPNWQEATPDQQKEFVELFSDLLAKTYLKKIRENAGTSKLEIVGEKLKGDKAIVKTTVEYAASVYSPSSSIVILVFSLTALGKNCAI